MRQLRCAIQLELLLVHCMAFALCSYEGCKKGLAAPGLGCSRLAFPLRRCTWGIAPPAMQAEGLESEVAAVKQ